MIKIQNPKFEALNSCGKSIRFFITSIKFYDNFILLIFMIDFFLDENEREKLYN